MLAGKFYGKAISQMDTTPKQLGPIEEAHVGFLVDYFVHLSDDERMAFIFKAGKKVCMNCCRIRESENAACYCIEQGD
jgi:hypothetical protein